MVRQGPSHVFQDRDHGKVGERRAGLGQVCGHVRKLHTTDFRITRAGHSIRDRGRSQRNPNNTGKKKATTAAHPAMT